MVPLQAVRLVERQPTSYRTDLPRDPVRVRTQVEDLALVRGPGPARDLVMVLWQVIVQEIDLGARGLEIALERERGPGSVRA